MSNDTDDQYMNAAEIAITTTLGEVPFIGTFISALVEIFWPHTQVDVWTQIKDKVENLIDSKIAAADYARVQTSLGDATQGSGLIGVLSDYMGAVDPKNPNGQDPATTWTSAHTYFIGASAAFQQAGIEVLLLPLFAQMANLHLALLKDGVTNKYCNISELSKYLKIYENWADTWVAKAIADSKARTEVFSGSTYAATWTSVNKVTRFMQISVVNYRELWPYFDPIAYPPPITTDIRSKVEIFYTFREALAHMQWPYCPTDYGSILPATPQDDVSGVAAYCVFDDPAGLCLLVGSQMTYAKGTSTPYSGYLYQGKPPQNPKHGRWVAPGGISSFLETAQPTAKNPITAVQGMYDNTGGTYFMDFTFEDATSTGELPSQAGTSPHYPNKLSIVPPTGYALSSLYTPGGGWYSAVHDVVLGFRMRF